MQPSSGSRYQSRKPFEKRCAARKSPTESSWAISRAESARAAAWRLKRGTSPSMFQNARRSRLPGCANTPPRPALLHSTPAAGICAENDISAGAVATPSSASKAANRGAALSSKTVKPMSTPCARPPSETSTVCAWPPNRSVASKSVTWACGARPRAAASPAMPEPMTAIRFIRAAPSARCARRGRGTGVRRRMSPSAPGGTREGGGRRRTPRGFQPARPAGSATKTGSSCPCRPIPGLSRASGPLFRHVEPL